MCIGDRVAGIDKAAECYRTGECGEGGCSKCQIKCTGCENCSHLDNVILRQPGLGDFVVVKKGVLNLTYKGPAWTPSMDLAIGGVAWVANGDSINGYHLKFTLASKEILEQFIYPPTSLCLAMQKDVDADARLPQLHNKEVI